MKRAAICVAAYAFGIFVPVIIFALTLVNETSSFIRFALPILTMSIAGYFSTAKEDRSLSNSAFWKWILASVIGALLIGVFATPSGH